MEYGYNQNEATACLDLIQTVYAGYEGIWAIKQSLGSFFVVIEKNSDGSYILVVRGTDPKKIYNLFVDVDVFSKNIFPIPLDTPLNPIVSSGIKLEYLAINKKIFEFLQTLSDDTNLILTGHSQGAALVELLAIGINNAFLGKFNIKTYAFAPPAVGNNDYKILAEKASSYGIFRIVNPFDIVPYFYGNILTIIKNNIPIKTPLLFKLLYYFTYTVHKLTKHKYVDVGTTIVLLEKVLIHCDDTFAKKIFQYECEVLKHHSAEHYKVLLDETNL